ncbi:MAG: helix-turn-helix transcriptional regulator [Rhodospirillales bacterium]|jgi:DNA-binding XRE family transcriptional regulator|nr:helix-turn-helix transcriptional regulator [Rhodospirillales bacterium]HIJ42505.1 helix-turn-helix transcriptional regulator [Rhodospirillaceae bacterium]MDP7215155.1 helix-turn-helix transcriptional regulator [Rhodospirillales bacterium]HIJ46096.1 helix-turn-helix transcriptional regulator [Rhodospirillaceae bacterium]HIJ92730.1 helix-turn-helix transcriptional regulator [Rhodospirillaceae bacterium]
MTRHQNATPGETSVQIVLDRLGRPEYALLPVEQFSALVLLARKGAGEALPENAPKGEIIGFDAMLDQALEFLDRLPLPERDEMTEEAAAIAAYDAAKERGEESFPAELACRLLDGDNPIKVYRQYRGLTQKGLAGKAGTKAAYISQIETGRRVGSTKTLRRVAKALAVDLDDIV